MKREEKQISKKKGVSLIVLVITIIVIIILAAAVILALNSNNPITNAKKATLQSDLKTYTDELSLYIANQYTETMGAFNPNEVNATGVGMKTPYIPTMQEKYYNIVEIQKGKLVVIEDATGTEADWAREILTNATPGSFGTNGSTVANAAKVNGPVLATGLTPIIFNEEVGKVGEPIEVETSNSNWYAYVGNTNAFKTDDTNSEALRVSKWANAKSTDGSQWVWIPRYAYKIPSGAGTSASSPIEVVFLKGTSDKYYDQATSTYLTAKRVGEAGAGVTEYMVHPAFTNETATNFANGGWDKEITGMWVAKYEAGDSLTPQDASIPYGGATTTKKYPAFKPNLISYGGIDIGDSYALSRVLNSSNNPYGFTASSDTHLMKNSEWGAVAYLTQSKYGRNGNEIRINNINSGSSKGLTGAGATTHNQAVAAIATVTPDNRYNGQYGKLASTTGNVYGIYDMSGGNWERTAGYLMNNHSSLKLYGKKMIDKDNNNPDTAYADNEATKYISTYKVGSSDTGSSNSAQADNKARKGEAIAETPGWNSDYAAFLYTSYPFFDRGGGYGYTSIAGAFYFDNDGGNAYSSYGFRPVLGLSL